MSSPLSGFTAVPNPQMLAFMGAQSFIMMFQAGEGWQYGKRKISAMTNEEFNLLTPERLLQNQAVTLRNSLETIQKSMNDMTPMIETIVRQYGDFLKEVIRVTPSVSLSVTGGKTPQEIVEQTVPSATSDERQALADFLKNLINLIPTIPSAGGEVSTTIPTDSTGGSVTIGPTLNEPTSGPSSIHYGGSPTTESAPTVLEGAFQPTGGIGPTERQRLEASIVELKRLIQLNLAQQDTVRANTYSRTVTRESYLAMIHDLDVLKANLDDMYRTLTLLKVKLGQI